MSINVKYFYFHANLFLIQKKHAQRGYTESLKTIENQEEENKKKEKIEKLRKK